jgi:hypothetical protein
VITTKRLGLDESLEAYAARIGISSDKARPFWRVEALVLLHLYPEEWDVVSGLCRIAPGVAVPTASVSWTEDGP